MSAVERSCKRCGKSFDASGRRHRKLFCSELCKKFYANEKLFAGQAEGEDYLVCPECGIKSKILSKHVKTEHGSLEAFCEKHGLDPAKTVAPSWRAANVEAQKKAFREGKTHGWGYGDDNPARKPERRAGRLSPFSLNYRGYDGLSLEEKQEKIGDFLREIAREKAARGNNPLTIAYYLKRGCTEAEARAKLHARQQTFTLAKCVAKHGAEAGRAIWKKRQEKWQASLAAKPAEELDRIYRAKMFHARGFSEMSQQLFREVAAKLPACCHPEFATSGEPGKFSERMVLDPDTGRCWFLDFFVPEANAAIEFDGEFWHSELNPGSLERDREKEEALKQLGLEKLLRVRERDWRAEPEKTVAACVDFIEEALEEEETWKSSL